MIIATLPTKYFSFILDPACFHLHNLSFFYPIFHIIDNLKEEPTSVHIDIIIPTYINSNDEVSFISFKSFFKNIILFDKPNDILPLKLNNDILKHWFNHHKDTTDYLEYPLNLLSLSNYLKSDVIITDNDTLINARYDIYYYHIIRICPLYDFPDIIDIIAHGNSFFSTCSSSVNIPLPFDIYYQMNHYKNRKYYNYYSRIIENINNKDLIENLRSALLNRYPYICFSRDMVKFYEIQSDHYIRREIRRYHFAIGYYLTNFYLLLWGMLDQLTVIAKYALDLKVHEKNCGIESKKFWKKLESKEPRLFKFRYLSFIDEWVSIMATMRHHAAHKGLKIPTQLVQETDEFKMTDDEILSILKKEEKFDLTYKYMPDDCMDNVVKPMLIQSYRIESLKPILRRAVHVMIENQNGFRDPVLSVDYDFERLNNFIDAFLITLFN